MTLTGLILALAPGGVGHGLGLGQRIALLEVSGIIVDDRTYLEQIRRFRRDRSVRGYVVAINSPGGVVGPAQSLFQELQRLRREDSLPIIASIGAVGASGGYYVALGADSIFVLPGSITGSIGVIMEFPDASRLLDRVGVQVEVVTSAEHKDLGSLFRPMTVRDRELVGELVDDVFDQFVNTVADERRLSPDAVRSIADGRLLSGRQAVAHGLVDRVGNLHDALAAAGRMAGLGEEPRLVRPPQRRFTLLDLLLGRGMAASLGALLRPLEDRSVGPRLKFVVPF
jgi:protease IV